jgi:transposase
MNNLQEATTDTVERNFDALSLKHVELQENYDVLEHNYAEVKQKLEFYEEQIRLLRHQKFGRSSEKTSPEQGLLEDIDEGEISEADLPDEVESVSYERKKKNKSKRNQFPIQWPRREILHDISDTDKVDAQGKPLTLIGYDTFEQVKTMPASHEVIIHKRPKYALELDDGSTQIKQAPPALVPLPKSIATPSLLADIITSKFVEHLPLHRYEQRCARQKFPLSRSTTSRWLIRLCEETELLSSLVSLLLERMQQLSILRCDETRFDVFNETNRKNPDSSLAYAWLLTGFTEHQGKPITMAYYHYSPSKSADVVNALLDDFSGHLVVDGYSGFDRLANLRRNTDHPIILSGCWDHARRRYKEAEKSFKKGDKQMALTHQGTALVNKLYLIEREIKDKSIDEKYAYRQAHTLPALDALKTWLDKTQPRINSGGTLGKAISYTQNQWGKLIHYTTNGELPISNILCEQQAKKFAVGRKNWMFANTPAGARASCMLYTLAVTACANQVNPFDYFRYLFAVLPSVMTLDELESLLPWCVDAEQIANFDEFSYCRGQSP